MLTSVLFIVCIVYLVIIFRKVGKKTGGADDKAMYNEGYTAGFKDCLAAMKLEKEDDSDESEAAEEADL